MTATALSFRQLGRLRPLILAWLAAAAMSAPSAAEPAKRERAPRDPSIAPAAADAPSVSVETPVNGVAGVWVDARQTTRGVLLEDDGSAPRLNHFVGSGNGFSGVLGVNQDSGLSNSQGNVVAIASAGEGAGALDILIEQRLEDSVISGQGGARTNVVHDSLNGARGIVQLNQSAGGLNQQLNVAAVVLGAPIAFGDIAIVQDNALAGVDARGSALPAGEEGDRTPRFSALTDSLSGFRGVFQGHQTTGNLNQVANVVAIGAPGGGQ